MSTVYVVCVRDPDSDNAFSVFPAEADVRIVDLDLGRGSNDAGRAASWRQEVADAPADVRKFVDQVIGNNRMED